MANILKSLTLIRCYGENKSSIGKF